MGLLFAWWAVGAMAQTTWSETKVLAPDGLPNDNFGQSVAISGDRILVGARGFNSAAGAAYVFRRDASGFTPEVKWTKEGGEPAEQFGNSVSLDGTTALVGCRLDNELGVLAGAAYVYVLEAGVWRLQQKLLPSDGGPRWQFGRSVAVQGDLALVGAFGEGNFTGSAYVFRRDNGVWREEAKLVAPERGALDYFGVSVSMSGDRAVMGAYGYRLSQGGPGAAFVYERLAGVWSLSKALAASDGEAEDGFGMGVALRGEHLLVGALNDDDRGVNAGAVYAFRLEGGAWRQAQKLTVDDGGDFDYLGWTVGLGDGVAVLGATGDQENRGTAHVFRFSCGEWRPVAKLEPQGGQPGIYFTRSVAIQGFDVLVGAHHDSALGNEAGAAYFYGAMNLPQDVQVESLAIERGDLVQGGLGEIRSDDDSKLIVRQRFPFAVADPNVRIICHSTSPFDIPARIAFKMRAQCSAVPLETVVQAVDLYDFVEGRYVRIVEARPTYVETYFEAQGPSARRFVEPASRRLMARISWFGGNVLSPSWTAALDQVVWTLEP